MKNNFSCISIKWPSSRVKISSGDSLPLIVVPLSKNFRDDGSVQNVGKMADFETLNLCMSLSSSQMCTYFCNDFITAYCLHLLKNSISHPRSFCNSFYYLHFVLNSHQIRVLEMLNTCWMRPSPTSDLFCWDK